MIPVTKPFQPQKEEYNRYIDGIWKRNWLTNNGPILNELELSLKTYLDLKHLLYVSNGTIALQIAIKALELSGEIITTPFSYVATTSSIVWEGCSPVFVDIDENTLNIDATKIESAITNKTSAILATHVFGNPCEIEQIQIIAKKHNLKVIYDAAHAFGVQYNGKSIFQYGDISTTSFHATKLFHTIEGGAVFTKDATVLRKMALLRNFGHTSATTFDGVGINGKNSEFHAAMGLCNLRYIRDILERRSELSTHYRLKLKELNASYPQINPQTDIYNYAYYPIIFEDERILFSTVERLNLSNIYPRRYFYPSLSTLNYVEGQDTPISNSIARRILCLPLYHDLGKEEIDMICRLILRVQEYNN
jgi:dTDP-4-amino-4,6-dideoxygalactose transaminase